ncbi:MAG: hypothetical protein E7638_00700 [Ruminococcaceae bacterium]|nr:hypothetical protein [Oscillospiraceae bacterium]
MPITNLLRIAELSVRQLSSDPCFFGNRFILSGDGCLFASKRPQNPKHMLRFIYLFSDAALITVIYIAFTALANITSTHDLWLSVHTDSDGAEIRLETNIPPIPTSKKEAAKTFSRCTETLISFALCLAETEGFAPSSAHDPEKNTYSIHLHIGKENKSEGEFRCGEPTGEEISELFQNAGLLAGLLNEKNSE